MNNLVPLTNDLVYESLWKGKYSKEYIIDFLNSYFHYYGDHEIKDITFLDANIFTDDKDIKKRIHIYYKRDKKEYYYELKFSVENDESIYFDVNFLPFLTYYGNYQSDNVKIGQIIIQFNNKVKTPIGHYYLKNENLVPMNRSFDIHIINVYALNNILECKDTSELNTFEIWIRILNGRNFSTVKKYAGTNELLLKYCHEWNFNSKVIRDKTVRDKDNIGDFAIKLLDDGYPITFVMKITKLEMSYLIDLKRKKEGCNVNTI